MFKLKNRLNGRVVILCWIFVSAAVACSDDTIHFYYDYETAVKEAKTSGRPIFLEFRCAP